MPDFFFLSVFVVRLLYNSLYMFLRCININLQFALQLNLLSELLLTENEATDQN